MYDASVDLMLESSLDIMNELLLVLVLLFLVVVAVMVLVLVVLLFLLCAQKCIVVVVSTQWVYNWCIEMYCCCC